MKKIMFFLLLTFSSFQYVSAALPPLYQSIREYEAILNSDELDDYLGSEQVIQALYSIPKGGYHVITQDKVLYVEIIYIGNEMAGPLNLEIKFHDLSID